MKIVLVTGGARAGKSRWAEEEAGRLGGDGVTYVATARAGDDEMARRISSHRAGRPAGWRTVEEPLAVATAVAETSDRVVLLDCLTLWVSNLLTPAVEIRVTEGMLPGLDDAESRIQSAVTDLLATAEARDGTLIVVTNEVGLGIVPGHPLARAYRDLLGWSNARVAREAERVVLMVAGLPTRIR